MREAETGPFPEEYPKQTDPLIYPSFEKEVEAGFELDSFDASDESKRDFIRKTAASLYFSANHLRIPASYLRIGSGMSPDGKSYNARATVRYGLPFIHYAREYIQEELDGHFLKGSLSDAIPLAAHESFHIWQWLNIPDEVEAAVKATKGDGEKWSETDIELAARDYSAKVYGLLVSRRYEALDLEGVKHLVKVSTVLGEETREIFRPDPIIASMLEFIDIDNQPQTSLDSRLG